MALCTAFLRVMVRIAAGQHHGGEHVEEDSLRQLWRQHLY
jgi:hypothetical protein